MVHSYSLTVIVLSLLTQNINLSKNKNLGEYDFKLTGCMDLDGTKGGVPGEICEQGLM